MVREKLFESVLKVRKVSDRLMAMKLEVKVSVLYPSLIVSAFALQVSNSMKEKNDFGRPEWVDKKCIKRGNDSSKCGLKWTCGRRKHRGMRK